MDFGIISSWVAASVAVVSAFVSVLWPWMTRKQPILEQERVLIDFSMFSENFGQLFVSCGLRSPEVLVRLTNNGDGVARSLEVEDTDVFETCFFFPQKTMTDESQFKHRVPVLAAGESVDIIFLSNVGYDVRVPYFFLSWREDPVRWYWNFKTMRFTVNDRLPAKRPLSYQERMFVLRYLYSCALQVGYSVEQFCLLKGINIEEVDPQLAPPVNL